MGQKGSNTSLKYSPKPHYSPLMDSPYISNPSVWGILCNYLSGLYDTFLGVQLVTDILFLKPSISTSILPPVPGIIKETGGKKE
jgi:hypothetical protein